jgi:hypothetical protein
MLFDVLEAIFGSLPQKVASLLALAFCGLVLLPGDQGERAAAALTRAKMHQVERELQPIVEDMVKTIKNMTPTTTTTMEPAS